MAKSRNRKKKTIKTQQTKKKKINLKEEINYIIKCAINHETKIILIKELILFCTETGDAWLLDTDDNLALDLAREGIKQNYFLIDTSTQFGIDWRFNYLIENEKFIYIDKIGIERTIFGHPTEQIKEHIDKYRS